MAILRPQVLFGRLSLKPRTYSNISPLVSRSRFNSSIVSSPNYDSFNRARRPTLVQTQSRKYWTGTPRNMPLDPSEYVSDIFKEGIFSMTSYFISFLCLRVALIMPVHDLLHSANTAS